MSEKNHNDIYKLKLHEQFIIRDSWGSVESVRRVPGGFIYNYKTNTHFNSCFVPYDEEFLNNKENV